MRFEDKVAVITGGGSGIGKETAKRFVNEGGSIVINGRDPDKTATAAREIDPSGTKAVSFAGDVSRPEVSEALVKAAVDRFGHLDILFNNAGIFTPKPFVDVTPDEYDHFLATILKGKFFTAQAAARVMRAAGRGGAIVQTSAVLGMLASAGVPVSPYSAANAGVLMLTKSLAIELAPDDIRVNAIALALIETPVFESFMTPEQVAQFLPTFHAFHPLGRNGQPPEAAEALLFLASDHASFITGSILPVDGGVSAGRS